MRFILDCQTADDVLNSNFLYLADGVDISSRLNNSLSIGDKIKLVEKVAKKISQEKLIFIGLRPNATIEENIIEAVELKKATPSISVVLNPNQLGLMICNSLIAKGVSTSLSPCLSVTQALLFAKIGVNFIFLPLGKLEDVSVNGIELVAEIRSVFDNYPDFVTQVITRSIRNLIHISESAKVRADAILLSDDMINKMNRSLGV